jgi:signal peptidase II
VEPEQANPKRERAVAQSIVSGSYRHAVAAVVALTCFSLDLITKTLARLYLPESESLPLLPCILRLTRVTNTGAAFSLGQHYAPVVAIVSTFVFLLLLAWSIRRYGKGGTPLLEEVGMAMVLGSAFGNLIDRYFFGRVTDFLEFQFIRFPVFNVADVLIDVGIGLALIASLKKGMPK